MARESKIEWTDHTWNPWQGCTKVSPGCASRRSTSGAASPTTRRGGDQAVLDGRRWTESPAWALA